MPAPKNLIHETSTTTGTGNLTVAAVSGKIRFSDATYGFGTGGTDVFDYFISNRAAAEWEIGTGHMSDANTLVRDTVVLSSNANAAVNFSAGTKDIANDIPAAYQARLDTANSWSAAQQFTTVELGHASDTTLSRSSAGVLAVEGVTVSLNSTSAVHTASTIELGHATDTTLARVSAGVVSIEGSNILTAATGQPLDADLTSIAALTTTAAGRSVLTVADNNLDQLVWWDDSAGTAKTMVLADMTTEASPAAGDYILVQRAEDDIVKVNWSSLPGASGVSATGTPADNQIAVWTAATTIEGSSALTFDGAANPTLQITSTDAGATAGPFLTLYRDSASPASNDIAGTINFDGEDTAGNRETYATIYADITPTSTAEYGRLKFSALLGGVQTTLVGVYGASGTNSSLSGTCRLGSPSHGLWSGLYLASAAAIDWNNGDVLITHSANALTFTGATSGYSFDDDILLPTSGSVINFNSGNVTITHSANALTVAGGSVIAAAGTTAIAPIKFQSGTNLTTAEAGALEYDGNCIYGTSDAGNRGVIPLQHIFIAPSGGVTLANSAAEQALFTAATDTLTLETGTYMYEMLIALSAMSSTSGNAAFDILGAGTATITRLDWIAAKDGALTTISAWSNSMNTAQSPAATATAGTGTTMGLTSSGAFRVTGAGTIIPSITLANAAAANVNENSYFRCYRVGSDTATSVGQWT